MHLLYELVKDISIHQPQQDEENGAHGATDYATDRTEAVKSLRHGGSGRSNHNGCDDDNPGGECSTQASVPNVYVLPGGGQLT